MLKMFEFVKTIMTENHKKNKSVHVMELEEIGLVIKGKCENCMETNSVNKHI